VRVEAARATWDHARGPIPEHRGRRGNLYLPGSRTDSHPCPPRWCLDKTGPFGSATLNLLSFELICGADCGAPTEAARADLLASEENRKAVTTTLVSDVAGAYFSLRRGWIINWIFPIARWRPAANRSP